MNTTEPLAPTPHSINAVDSALHQAQPSSEHAAAPAPQLADDSVAHCPTTPPLPPSPTSRHRRGSIARLPKTIRDQINQMLDDGFSYAAIRRHLAQQDIILSDDSIGRWKKGGYQDYLRQLRLLEESRLRFELTLDLANEHKTIDVFQAAHKIAAAQICDAVAEIGPDSLRLAIKLDPQNLLRIFNCLSRLTNGGLKCEHYLMDNARFQQQQQPPSSNALRPETLERIERELQLL